MIEIKNCSKAFGKIQAVNKVTMDIGEREVFGLIGSNGAGKSTLLRIMAGIIRQDRGEVLMDEEPVFENERIKEHFFYIPDDAYIPANYNALDMAEFYIHKIQCVLTDKKKEEELKKELEVLKTEHQGSLLLITARGTRREIMEKIQAKNPLFCEVLPLTLEEIFISETEVAGYEVKNLFQ